LANLLLKLLVLLVIVIYALATRKERQSLNQRLKEFSVKDGVVTVMLVLVGG